MPESERKIIQIPEITRVEGHESVVVEIEDGRVTDVKLDVFEGTRFFERIVLNHKYDEIPHITSRVCAICSTGHVLAAIFAVERIIGFTPSKYEMLFRELMHLGMIIESNATHVCALALPDFLGAADLAGLATEHPREFEIWLRLRKLGATLQTAVGGRPFHPVNLHVGGLSRYPDEQELASLTQALEADADQAIALCDLLLGIEFPFEHTYTSPFLSLISNESHYGYFGERVICSLGWEADVNEYTSYLDERTVSYSHAKQSTLKGQTFMVGSIARLHFFHEKLGQTALSIYRRSPLAQGNQHTLLNNLAQTIEIVEAIDRARQIVKQLASSCTDQDFKPREHALNQSWNFAGKGTGAVECPRGTLYHHYELDSSGTILAADMITPSAQNTARIESDIRSVTEEYHSRVSPEVLQAYLETLVRAYDPCNTCATHAVKVNYISRKGK